MKKQVSLILCSMLGWALLFTACDKIEYEGSPTPSNQSISILLKDLPVDAVGKTLWFYTVNSDGDILNTERAKALTDSILTFQAPNETPYQIGVLITSDQSWSFSENEWPDGYVVKSDWLKAATQYLEINSYGTINKPGSMSSIVYCAIESPDDGSYYGPNSIVNVSVNASYDEGFISEVTFSVDGELIETQNYREPDSNYEFQWNTKGKAALRYYKLEVTAKNNKGQTATSSINVYLTQEEAYGPSIEITGFKRFDTDSLYVEAYAYANNDDDTISMVEFYFDGTKKSTDTEGYAYYYDCSFSIKGEAEGVHELKAVVTDSKNRKKSVIANFTLSTSK